MKKVKNLILAALTFILSFCMINTVFADNNGSIVVKETTAGKTYEIYKIFDLTYSDTKVAYTIDSDWINFFNNDGKEYIVDTNPSNLNQITVDNAIKYINITNDNIATFTQKALAYATSKTADKSAEAEGDTLTFENLELGYYLIYPKGATNIKNTYGSICSITSTVPTAEVNIKATYPTITKDVDDQNVEVGQLVTFTITGQVPDTTGYTTYTYEIKDTMSAGLELDSELTEFTVKFGDTPITDVSPIYNDNGFTLTYDMTNYQAYKGQIITITYKVKVTEEAIASDTTKNSATLTYSNDPKDATKTTTTPPVEKKVYSSEINVIKVDAKNNETKLAGASFVLKNAAGDFYQAIIIDGKLTDIEWVKDQTAATLLVTDETGIVTFGGIENGTYYLVEVDAPEGYNKLAKPVTVKVGYSDEEGTTLGEVAVSHNEIIENNSGIALPITGGIGTKIFIGIGSLLTIVSAIILITNKRINKEN